MWRHTVKFVKITLLWLNKQIIYILVFVSIGTTFFFHSGHSLLFCNHSCIHFLWKTCSSFQRSWAMKSSAINWVRQIIHLSVLISLENLVMIYATPFKSLSVASFTILISTLSCCSLSISNWISVYLIRKLKLILFKSRWR